MDLARRHVAALDELRRPTLVTLPRRAEILHRDLPQGWVARGLDELA